MYLFILSLLINIISLSSYIFTQGALQEKQAFEQLEQKYPLLSKRALQEFPQDIRVNFLDLRKALREQVQPFGDTFGFYFEYLPTGTSIGVNEKDEFHAASLFKVPVTMAYYHLKERIGDPTKDPEVEIKEEHLDNRFGNLWQKGVGYKIKLSEVVKLVLEQSDNTAAKILATYITRQDFEQVYEGLDIELQINNESAILTPKNYSSILKALYFSSVLNRDSSQEILSYLAKTSFPDKLAAGVPIDVTIAHKIGDYTDNQGNEAFMDCGIVYIPRRPYMLCMLSKTDEQTARERMGAVSKTIYDYVSSVD